MADAIQREGGAERRIRAGMCGSDGGSRRQLPCRRSLRKAEEDGFTIWRTPYSEKEARSAGFELACVDRTEEAGGSCRAGGACGRQRGTDSPYGGRHTDSGGEADMSHIIVAFSKRENAANIRNILMRSGMDVSAVCTTGAAVLQNADTWNEGIVICGCQMQDMQYTRLRELLPERFEMLLVVQPDRWMDTELPDGVVGLPMPVKVYDLISSVEMMAEAMERRRRKRRSRGKERSAGDRAVVEQAKAVLMERNNMSEEEAHRYLQKCSMESGTNMVETAQMVLTIMN